MPPRPKDRLPSQPRLTAEQLAGLHTEVDAQAKEVLGHMYQAILKTPEFTLSSGMKCRVDPYFEPEVNAEGELKCGFDVLLGDSGHLEFTMGHTGWGRALAAVEVQKKARRGRAR
jgi:hypothetical protein